MIHHLSYPEKQIGSINAGICDESAAVQYAGINEAIQEIKRFGRQVFLSKTDVRSGFRITPVSPSDYELLGFKWKVCSIMTAVYHLVTGQAAKFSKNLIQLLNE
jgi:hypothetical protein